MAYYEFNESGGVTLPDSFTVGTYRTLSEQIKIEKSEIMLDGYWRVACALGEVDFEADGVTITPHMEFDTVPYRVAAWIKQVVDDWSEPFLATPSLSVKATGTG